MPLPSDVDREVATGQYGSVVFAVKSDERMAEAWYWKANLPKKKWKSFESLCKRLVNEGFIINEEQFKLLHDDVFEFKRGGDRLLCFRVGKRWLLTNALKKSGRKNITDDINKSTTIGEKHLEWEKSREKKLTT